MTFFIPQRTHLFLRMKSRYCHSCASYSYEGLGIMDNGAPQEMVGCVLINPIHQLTITFSLPSYTVIAVLQSLNTRLPNQVIGVCVC